MRSITMERQNKTFKDDTIAFRLQKKEKIKIKEFTGKQRIPTATWIRKTILDEIDKDELKEKK